MIQQRTSFLHLVGTLVCAIACFDSALGGTNAQITRLIQEKNQKLAQLEQCANKTKNFKIAGISTLGLTVAGVGGNIMLASKKKDLQKQIQNTKTNITKQEEKLAEIEARIPDVLEAKKQREKEAEDNKNKEKAALAIRMEACAADENATWVEAENNCKCKEGFKVDSNGKCIEKTSDDLAKEKQEAEKENKKKACTGDHKQWDEKADKCGCESGYTYYAYTGKCISKADEAKANSCSASNGSWDETNSKCNCANGFEPDENGTCINIAQKSCTGDHKQWDEKADKCGCESGYTYYAYTGKCELLDPYAKTETSSDSETTKKDERSNSSTNPDNLSILLNPTEKYGRDKKDFCNKLSNEGDRFEINVQINAAESQIKKAAGLGYWCIQSGATWDVLDIGKGVKSAICSKIPAAVCDD